MLLLSDPGNKMKTAKIAKQKNFSLCYFCGALHSAGNNRRQNIIIYTAGSRRFDRHTHLLGELGENDVPPAQNDVPLAKYRLYKLCAQIEHRHTHKSSGSQLLTGSSSTDFSH